MEASYLDVKHGNMTSTTYFTWSEKEYQEPTSHTLLNMDSHPFHAQIQLI